MKDATGRVIRVGDRVAYVIKTGTRGWAKFSTVTGFTFNKVEIGGNEEMANGCVWPGSLIIIPPGGDGYATDRTENAE